MQVSVRILSVFKPARANGPADSFGHALRLVLIAMDFVTTVGWSRLTDGRRMEIGDLGKIFSRTIAKITATIGGWIARPGYRHFVAFARDLFHVLWICRISVLSVAVGLAVFSIAPQSRDI